LKDKGFLTVVGQNPPFELRRKLAFRLQSFHEIHRGSSEYWANPSISVGASPICIIRERWPELRTSSGANQRALRNEADVLFPFAIAKFPRMALQE